MSTPVIKDDKTTVSKPPPVSKDNTVTVPKSTAVSKDDTILVPKFEGSERIVNWTEGAFNDKNATYVVLEFAVKQKAYTSAKPTDQDQAGGILFVEKSKLEDFKTKAVTGTPNTFIVTIDFEYGQKSSDGTERWLVYHNKDYKMYQHRFFDKWNWTTSPEATALAKKFKFDAVLSGADNLKWLIGQKLRNF